MDSLSRIQAFLRLKDDILSAVDTAEYRNMMAKAEMQNGWFDTKTVRQALVNLAFLMDVKDFVFTSSKQELFSGKRNVIYLKSGENGKPSDILVVCAGNVPAVAFHDIMCILLSGNRAWIKLSSKDNVIIPFLLDRLALYMPEVKDNVIYIDGDIKAVKKNISGVIATGSDSSALVFESYFKDIPHIIRKSRYSVALIRHGDDIHGLEDDICLYYGMGCRSISHLLVPKEYDFEELIKKLQKYSYLNDMSKYKNNSDYQKALMIMNGVDFIDAGGVLLTQKKEMYSPVSVVGYSYYDDIGQAKQVIEKDKEFLQCVADSKGDYGIRFGCCQKPLFTDYADSVDIMLWLGENFG